MSLLYGHVAKWSKALDCGSRDRGFESHYAHLNTPEVRNETFLILLDLSSTSTKE